MLSEKEKGTRAVEGLECSPPPLGSSRGRYVENPLVGELQTSRNRGMQGF